VEEIPLTPDNDLYYGLTYAGSSYALATEFLYKVYKRPGVSNVA
jgi:hypothetical protein